MFSFLLAIIRAIILKLATTGVFNFMMPTLLKLDKWCEEKIGIDIIKQEQKWFEKHPLLRVRIEKLEKNSHTPKGLYDMDGYKELLDRLTELEQETLTLAGHIEKLEKK